MGELFNGLGAFTNEAHKGEGVWTNQKWYKVMGDHSESIYNKIWV